MALLISSSFPSQQSLISLTNNVYKLTLLFPKKEPLRYKMREAADEILAVFFRLEAGGNEAANGTRVFEEFEVLNGFFEVVKFQNWVSSADALNIQQEYNKLRETLLKIKQELPVEKEEEEGPEEEVQGLEKTVELKDRQRQILEIIKEKNKVQVWQIKKIFPDISKRTLRRDFEKLLKFGVIKRVGERNDTFYQPS